MNAKYVLLLSPLIVSGCSWNALHSQPSIAAVQVAFENTQKPIPGKYLVYVNGEGLDQKVQVGGVVCTSHDFKLQIAYNFQISVRRTLGNILEKTELVSIPQTTAQIKAAGAKAYIAVKAGTAEGHLVVTPGFTQKETVSKVQITANVRVESRKKVLTDQRVEGTAQATPVIGRCLDGHVPASEASTKALKQIVERIGEIVKTSLQ